MPNALPFQTISSVSLGAAVVITSSVSSVQYQDAFAYQIIWSGPLTGTIDVQGSLNYKTGKPQGTGALNAGDWVSIVQTSPNTLPVSIGSGTSQALLNMSQIGFAYTRLQYTHSSGNGVMNAYFTSKSWSDQ